MADLDLGIVKPSRELRFREALRELLEIRGFSRRRGEVAKAVFISHSALSQYLSGRAVPSLDTLIRLSVFFNTSLDYLVFGTEFVEKETVDPGFSYRRHRLRSASQFTLAAIQGDRCGFGNR